MKIRFYMACAFMAYFASSTLLLSAQENKQIVQVPDLSQYILTPEAPQTPRINCAKIFGVRPGSPLIFTVATTGKRPMIFKATGLPVGVILNAQTGELSGKVLKKGEYRVTLHASNSLGKDSRTLKIVVGDNIALTPPMGWNSWNCWGNSVSQEKVMSSAKAMVDKGLINYGWTYINIDDGWQGVRGGKYNAIQPNRKFPNMVKLANEIHHMGLKIGIYSGPWVGTYAGHVGSMCDNQNGTYEWINQGMHNENYQCVSPQDNSKVKMKQRYCYHGKYSFAVQDAKQWADWGIDYLKYDWFPNDYYYCKDMAEALHATNRDIIYSLSNSAPFGSAPVWMNLANCWRTAGDIRDTWDSMYKIGFLQQDRWIAFNRPGHWTDPDMMILGMVGWGPTLHYTHLTVDEQYTHVSLWALMAAPMLIGCDMAQLDKFTLSLLCNNEVNDVNQDPLGLQAYPVYRDSTYVTYVKQLEDGSMAVGMFNLSDKEKTLGFIPRNLGIRGKQNIRDLWRQKDLQEVEDTVHFNTQVAPHGVVLVKIYPGNTCEKVVDKPHELNFSK